MDNVRAEVTEMDGKDEAAARELLAAAAATIPPAADGAYETRDGVIAAGLVADPRKRRTRQWVERLTGLVLTVGIGFGVRAAIQIISPSPPSPASVVNAAIAKTTAGSYSATVTLTFTKLSPGSAAPVVTTESLAYDPTRQAGDLTAKARGGAVQYQRVGGYTYIRTADGVWTRQPVTVPYPVVPSVLRRYGAAGILFADPRAVLPLSDWGANVSTDHPASVSGPGWHGTRYLFLAIAAVDRSGKQQTIIVNGTKEVVHGDFVIVSGSVSVDSFGRIRELVESMEPSTSEDVYTLNVTYSGYGAPVRVSAPPTDRPDK